MISFRVFQRLVASIIVATLSLCLPSGLSPTAMAEDGRVSVIPKPMRMQTGKGAFTLVPGTKVLVEKDSAAVGDIGRRLAEKLVVTTPAGEEIIEGRLIEK